MLAFGKYKEVGACGHLQPGNAETLAICAHNRGIYNITPYTHTPRRMCVHDEIQESPLYTHTPRRMCVCIVRRIPALTDLPSETPEPRPRAQSSAEFIVFYHTHIRRGVCVYGRKPANLRIECRPRAADYSAARPRATLIPS